MNKSKNSNYRSTLSNSQVESYYTKTLNSARSHLSKNEINLSYIIHNKTIFYISEMASKFIFRPVPTLTGSIVAFAVAIASYTLSYIYGYSTTGLEILIAFIVGWIIGIAYDIISKIIKH